MLWYKGGLRLLLDYLTSRKQRTKIGSVFSSWCNINIGAPQRPILGPLLFKDTHREQHSQIKTPVKYEKYEYRHLGSWYIKSALYKGFLN